MSIIMIVIIPVIFLKYFEYFITDGDIDKQTMYGQMPIDLLDEKCARPAYFEDVSPNNSRDHVLIVGAQATGFSWIKTTNTVWISETTTSSDSGMGGIFPVFISLWNSLLI